MMKYEEYFKDVRWRVFREKVFAKDGRKCVSCGTQEGLQAHHTFYDHGDAPWDYPLESMKTLCWECHDNAEFIILAMRNQPEAARRLIDRVTDELMRLNAKEAKKRTSEREAGKGCR